MTAWPRRPAARVALRWLVRAAVLLALAAVFMAYLNPHRVVDLANRLWACGFSCPTGKAALLANTNDQTLTVNTSIPISPTA